VIKLLNIFFFFLIKFYFGAKIRFLNNQIYEFLLKIFHYNYLKYFGVETKFGYVKLIGLPIIQKNKNSRIKIGKNVTLVSKSTGNVAGINHPVILATMAEGASIKLENGCGLSGSSICSVKSITICEKAGLGVNTKVYDTDFHSIDRTAGKPASLLRARSKPIKIGKNSWIGGDVVILKGVTIGENAVVGAGSVVVRNVAENVLSAGNPARVIRVISEK